MQDGDPEIEMRASGTMRNAIGTVTVLTVDDHPRFLEAARAVVEASPGFRWAGGASSGAEALAAVGREEPDLILVDVNMPEMDGFELARELGLNYPRALVALISAKRPDELPRAGGNSERQAVLAKENLGPSLLRELWQKHRGNLPPAK